MYEVSWTTRAKEVLRHVIESASSRFRARIVAAAHRMQSRLITEGPETGESRHGNFRVVIELPLVAYIWVGTDGVISVIRILVPGR